MENVFKSHLVLNVCLYMLANIVTKIGIKKLI